MLQKSHGALDCCTIFIKWTVNGRFEHSVQNLNCNTVPSSWGSSHARLSLCRTSQCLSHLQLPVCGPSELQRRISRECKVEGPHSLE